MAMKFFHWFNAKLKTHPLITNCCSSAFIAGCGDCMAQTFFRYFTHSPDNIPRLAPDDPARQHPLVWERKDTGVFDLRRTAIFMSFTFTLGTPMWLAMYGWLDRMVPGKTLMGAFKKGWGTWGFGFITSPVFIFYIKSVETLVFQGASVSDAMKIIRNEMLSKLYGDMPLLQGYGLLYWSLHWVPLFYLLPHHVRLVYASTVQVGWSTISSWIVHRDHKFKKFQEKV